MATTKSMKIQAEIDKVKAKISEQQARLKELEQKKLEAENSEIVDIVRGMSISLTELPLLFEKLKAFKEQLAEAGDGTPVQRLTAFTREVREEYEGKKQAGLLTRAQIHRYEDICGTLDQYLLAAGEAEAQDGEALFGMLAARFGEGREQYEDQCRAVLQMVEYAFDLMEGAFGDSQEMVIFITELNTSYDAVRFLEENPCERYYQYNRKLLFEDREADIKRKLERLL